MAERLSAKIWIGGTIKRSIVSDLIDKINEQEVAAEYGDATLNIENEEELLRYLGPNLTLEFCDEEARWGEFSDLEFFLTKNQIPFLRQSEGGDELMPEVSYLTDSMDCPLTEVTDTDGNKVYSKDDLQSILNLIEQGDTIINVINTLKRMLQDIPDVPRFEIVED